MDEFAVASNELDKDMLDFKINGMIIKILSCLVNEEKEKGIFMSQLRKKTAQAIYFTFQKKPTESKNEQIILATSVSFSLKRKKRTFLNALNSG